MTQDHRADAVQLLDALGELHPHEVVQANLFAAQANVSALLAIEARLGELVEQQRIANALTGTGHMGVFNSDAEIRPARNAVRRLLGLPVTEEG
ncbi:hypothetical protein [Nocardia asiatica]